MSLDPTTLRLMYVRRVVVTLANALGLDGAMTFSRWLARGVFDLNTPARRRAERNLVRAYGDALTPEERGRLTRSVFEQIAAFWVEAFFAHRRLRVSSWQQFVAFEDPARVRSMASSPRGALLVTGYFGNLAVAAYALGQVARPLHVVIDEVQHPVLKAWQDELYRQPNVELLARARAKSRLADLLSDGAKVLMVGEHVRPRGRGVTVEYLGRPCRCYPTVGMLARWCDVPVYVVTARRGQRPFRFILSCELTADPRRLPSEQDAVEAITRQYMRCLETVIRRWPTQYLWTRIWDRAEAEAERASRLGLARSPEGAVGAEARV